MKRNLFSLFGKTLFSTLFFFSALNIYAQEKTIYENGIKKEVNKKFTSQLVSSLDRIKANGLVNPQAIEMQAFNAVPTNKILSITDERHKKIVAVENSKITISPQNQEIKDIAIKDKLSAIITVKNTGKFPLTYFIPGFDAKRVSESWPTAYHKYGYVIRSNKTGEINPITYEYKDISKTGKDITKDFDNADYWYKEVDLGFSFPYYETIQDKLYISKNGFITFDKSIKPSEIPDLGNATTPKGNISIFGQVINYKTSGKIYYQIESDRIIVQYQDVKLAATTTVLSTAQMVLLANGDIRFYYLKSPIEPLKRVLNILIEDLDKKDGILFHNKDMIESANAIALKSGFALGFDYPGPNIISSIENASATLEPNHSIEVKVNLTTDNLHEGEINRYINFISNNAESVSVNALIKLQINSGGKLDYKLSNDSIDFGDVYLNKEATKELIIRNVGTKIIEITKLSVNANSFSLESELGKIEPKLSKRIVLKANATTKGKLSDYLRIELDNLIKDSVLLQAKIIGIPDISINDLNVLKDTLKFGTSSLHLFEISNSGDDNLSVSIKGNHWISFVADGNKEFDYDYNKLNDGTNYNWLDIKNTGVKVNLSDDNKIFWYDLNSKFPIKFYGKEYSKLKISPKGIISVENNPPILNSNFDIPLSDKGGYVMPLWLPNSEFDTNNYPDDAGLYYRQFDDKLLISWEYIKNDLHSLPISVQAIIYKDGQIKFQYKQINKNYISDSFLVGIQKSGADKFIKISKEKTLDFGKGVSYNIIPNDKYSLSKGEKIEGRIKLSASNVYSGTHKGELILTTNIPDKEPFKKPLELYVRGAARLNVPDTIDLGNLEIIIKDGQPKIYYVDLDIENTGNLLLKLTNAKLTKKDQGLDQLYQMQDKWVSVTDVFSIKPKPVFDMFSEGKLKTKISFAPIKPGVFEDELSLTTNTGVKKIVLKATAFSNRAPVYIGANPLEFSTIDFVKEYNIEDLFQDAEGDKIKFISINVEDAGVLSVTNSENKLSIKTLQFGKTKLNFIVADELDNKLTSTVDVIIDLTLGVEEIDKSDSNMVYPNPFTDQLYLSNVYSDYRIYDISGVLVVQKKLKGEKIISTAMLERGVYIIKLWKDGKLAITRKVIKK